MKSKINLYWYKHKEGHGNFGDELNHYIIRKLSNLEINHIDIGLFNLSPLLFFKVNTYSLLKRNISIIEYFKYLYYYFVRKPKVLVGIGSVLGGVNSERYVVWGSGILNKNDKFKKAHFKAVRGKFSQKRIIELGYNAPDVIGDPALLMPILYKPKFNKKNKIGIIPHFVHYNELKHLENTSIKVINLLDPIEKIIDEINLCHKTLSTSLHGIIVSHAYNIPSLWVDFEETNEKKLVGDNIKFKDYFSSVNIKSYSPIQIKTINGFVSELFDVNEKYLLPDSNIITEIQENLIKVAPFPIIDLYK